MYGAQNVLKHPRVSMDNLSHDFESVQTYIFLGNTTIIIYLLNVSLELNSKYIDTDILGQQCVIICNLFCPLGTFSFNFYRTWLLLII